MPVSSVPLSETHIAGRPRAAMRASSSRATRSPGSEVSATSARHSRVKSSTIARMRNRRPSAERIRQEVQAPALIGTLRQRHRRSCAQRTLAAAAPAHLQPFLAVEPAELLVVHDDAFAAEQDVQPPIAEPPAKWRPARAAAPAPPHRPAGCCDSGPMCDPLRALEHARRSLTSNATRR